MADFTDGTTTGVVTRDTVNSNFKIIKTFVPATFVWGTDHLVMDLTKYGCSKVHGVFAFQESTASSIVLPITGNTTSVSSGTLTIVSGSTGGASSALGGTFLILAD